MRSPTQQIRDRMIRRFDIVMDLLAWRHREWQKMNPSFSPHYVPGEGPYRPTAFVIGEAPGAQEDVQRRPFVGAAGTALRALMSTAGLYSTPVDSLLPNTWITNVIKFRPERNRTPIIPEIDSVRQLLFEEWIAVGKPQLIIPVGRTALYAVYGRQISITRVSGQLDERASVNTTSPLFIWPMIHPSFAIRNKQAQPLLERDWAKLGTWRGMAWDS
jgi:uracil-DNA glycosylase family 4